MKRTTIIIAAMVAAGFLAAAEAPAKEDCQWGLDREGRTCFADDMDRVVEGTWGEPLLKPYTDELRNWDELFPDLGEPAADPRRRSGE